MRATFAFLLAGLLTGGTMLFAQVELPPASSGTDKAKPSGQASVSPTLGPQTRPAPMTEKEVITELKKKDNAAQLLKELNSRGVDFELNEEIEKALRKAKATDEEMKAIQSAGPKAREAAVKSAAVASGQLALPKDETVDYQALQNELDPDKGIALANAFLAKFPNSEALSYVYSIEAMDYETKGDIENIVDYAGKAVAHKADNFLALMLLAYYMPQPQYINKHQAEEDADLTKADTCDHEAVAAINKLKKQMTESDDDFARRKAGYLADLHADEGMIHLQRAQMGLMSLDQDELAKAEKEYRLAVTGTDHPDATAYFRLGDACRLQGKLDDAIAAFTKASDLGKGPIKQFADDQVARLKAQKAQAGATTAKP